jgi:transposase-like protein
MRQVALDFGISAATLYQWLGKAEIKEGLRQVVYLIFRFLG